jgi:EAL domain-containing protein (putative c-di-GMP-specific phosphodiesterase class I)
MNDLRGRENGHIGLNRVVELTLRQLGVDAVYIAELTGARAIYRGVAGDAASFGVVLDDGRPAEATYCGRLVAGGIPGVIFDATGDERVADLPVTREAPIGSFIGVPLRLSDGSLYGALCGVSHAPAPNLDDQDLRFMAMLGELITAELDERRREERLRSDLLGLIEREDLRVAYQPIFDLHGEDCLGIEALARFPEPFAGPEETLAAAERLGLSLELERLVARHAWSMLPLLGPGQFLALNVSPGALIELARRANLAEDLVLSQLVVEVTEHAIVECYEELHRELTPLRRRGLRIAVDDAGAGYASLRHVLELRPDFIKVDRSLIDGIAGDHARRAAVRAFLSIALDMGSRVIAEGVEQSADLLAVRELGLHAVQGYLLGRPSTDADTVAGWIGPQERAMGGEQSQRRRTSFLPRRRPVKAGIR